MGTRFTSGNMIDSLRTSPLRLASWPEDKAEHEVDHCSFVCECTTKSNTRSSVSSIDTQQVGRLLCEQLS